MTANPSPPSAGSVAHRAFALAALTVRDQLERDLRDLPAEWSGRVPRLWERVVVWLTASPIWPETPAGEQEMINQPLGRWSEREIIRYSWRSEFLGILLWSLGRIGSLPPVDTLFDPAACLSHLPLDGDPSDIIAGAALRPPQVITATWRTLDLWHWRLQVYQAERLSLVSPSGWTWPKIVRVTLELANNDGCAIPSRDDDFACFGRTFRTLDDQQCDQVSTTISERLEALRWLRSPDDTADRTASYRYPNGGISSADAHIQHPSAPDLRFPDRSEDKHE